MKDESGRTLNEMLAILAIVGVLSITGIVGYFHMLRQRNVDTILNTLQQKIVEINSAQATHQITDPDKLNAFLENYTTDVGSYRLSFHAADEMDGSFVSEVTNKDGSKIKGAFCRQLMTKMAEQQFVADVSFSLKDEEQEDGTTKDISVSLNGQTIKWADVCGD